MMPPQTASQAEALIKHANARVTAARVRVLGFLLASARAYSHHEIARRLAKSKPIDTVTLYRVLDWLTETGLAHRFSGNDQVWRFTAAGVQGAHGHAHFLCTKCTTVTCVPEVKLPRKIALPAGFRSQAIDFLIKGTCPRCA